jgi:hypothetical protein
MIVMLSWNMSILVYLSLSFKSPSFILLMLSNGPPSSIVLAHRWSWNSLRWIARSVQYLFIYLCFGVSVSTVDRVLNSTCVDLYRKCVIVRFSGQPSQSGGKRNGIVLKCLTFNYGRRSQPYLLLTIATQMFFFHNL